MDREKEAQYLQFALDNPNILCSEVPHELLEEASSDDEPTKWFEEFFAAGYTQWLKEKYGRRARFFEQRINNAIMVLWLRAGRLHTNMLMDVADPDLSQPFFSDEGLYD